MKKNQHKVHWKEFPGKATPEEPAPTSLRRNLPSEGDPRRCIAQTSTGRGPCKNWARKGQNVCGYHGGAAPAAKKRAGERLLAAADLAAGQLIEFMVDPKVPYATRLGAVSSLLNRVGLAGASELVVEVKPWEKLMDGLSRQRPANAAPAPEPRVGGLSRARPSFGSEREIPPAPPGTLALGPAEREVTASDVVEIVEAELVEERPVVVPPNAMRSFDEIWGDVPNPMDPPLYGRGGSRLGRGEFGR